MSPKTIFDIDKKLLDLEEVKSFLNARPKLKLEGLIQVDRNTCRVFWYQDISDNKSLTSEMISLG